MPQAREHTVRFIKFSSVGIICAALNVLILWVATYMLDLHYALAVVFSFFFVNLVGYGLNRAITFGDRHLAGLPRLGRYYIVMGGSLILNLSLMAVLIDGLGVSIIGASIIVTLVFVLFNYLSHSSWTYAEGQGDSSRNDG